MLPQYNSVYTDFELLKTYSEPILNLLGILSIFVLYETILGENRKVRLGFA